MISFTCNICGTGNALEEIPWEEPTCTGCGSNVRMRALIYLLSIELFGAARTLPEFPKDKKIRGFGLSDALLYATPLGEKVDYTNTFYDRQPYLDITQPHPEQYGTYDFILSSDVFEHVATPVELAFEEAFRLLKPHGVLCITVPSSAADEDTVEYYPDLHEYSIVELGGEHVLINRKKDKTLEIHQNLEFHGGIGATLVMRQFSQRDMAGKLRGSGFVEVEYQTESVMPFGIVLVGNWSLPLVARKVARAAGAAPVYNPPPVVETRVPVQEAPVAAAAVEAVPVGNPQLENQILRLHNEKATLERRVAALESQLRMAADSRWLKLGRRLGYGPKLR
jgi:SAM-dependent methyltransferase